MNKGASDLSPDCRIAAERALAELSCGRAKRARPPAGLAVVAVVATIIVACAGQTEEVPPVVTNATPPDTGHVLQIVTGSSSGGCSGWQAAGGSGNSSSAANSVKLGNFPTAEEAATAIGKPVLVPNGLPGDPSPIPGGCVTVMQSEEQTSVMQIWTWPSAPGARVNLLSFWQSDSPDLMAPGQAIKISGHDGRRRLVKTITIGSEETSSQLDLEWSDGTNRFDIHSELGSALTEDAVMKMATSLKIVRPGASSPTASASSGSSDHSQSPPGGVQFGSSSGVVLQSYNDTGSGNTTRPCVAALPGTPQPSGAPGGPSVSLVSSVEDAARIAGFQIAAPRLLPPGFEERDCISVFQVNDPRGLHVSVMRHWVWVEEPWVGLSLQQERPAQPGEGTVESLRVSGVLAGPLTDDLLRRIADSVEPRQQ